MTTVPLRHVGQMASVAMESTRLHAPVHQAGAALSAQLTTTSARLKHTTARLELRVAATPLGPSLVHVTLDMLVLVFRAAMSMSVLRAPV
jgi:hypothetical protein